MLEGADKERFSPKHEHKGQWVQETSYDGFPKVIESSQGQ